MPHNLKSFTVGPPAKALKERHKTYLTFPGVVIPAVPAQKHCRDRRNDGGAVVISFADSVGSEQIPTAVLNGPHFQASGFAGGI